MRRRDHALRVGCSGWNYDHWRDRFYPRGLPTSRWLERYAETFDTVEVNATFYRLPTRVATTRWTHSTPDDFLFAVKASRYLTHVKRLRDLADGWARFFERIEPIAEGGKLGPILWQLPERFHRDDDRLAEALERLPRLRHAFEFRHASWFASEVVDILRRHGAALVVGDSPRRPFQTRDLTTGWTYVRFHQGRGRGGNYTRRQLEEWSRQVEAWLRDVDVYAYFNDDWNAYAIEEARRLRRLVCS